LKRRPLWSVRWKGIKAFVTALMNPAAGNINAVSAWIIIEEMENCRHVSLIKNLKGPMIAL